MPNTRWRAALVPDARGLVALGLAVALIHLALIQPNHPAAATWGAFRLMPLELPILVLALVVARGRIATILRGAIAGVLGLMVVIKAADLAGHVALGRSIDPVLDLHLAVSGWRLLSGTAGAPAATAAAVGLVLAAGGAFAALWWATGRIAAIDAGPRLRPALALILVPAVGLAAIDADYARRPFDPPGAAFTARLAYDHVRASARARADLADFRRAAALDPALALPADAILSDLRGVDVLVIFVESYGRAALDDPAYARTIRATLAGLAPRLAARGLAARSGYLTSPIVGGQSWLAHASLLSGLPIGAEGRYRALVASPRRTLMHLAQRAGWRSVAVMPAITLAWPDAAWFGYDRVLAAGDLGYAGPPFDWVTMPDQFALAAFERAELGPGPRPPVFAEIALVSSHAPWTPVPPMLDWDALGDGSVFAEAARAGPSPKEVWRDPDRVRDQFRLALDYSLQAAGGFAARPADRPRLIVLLGDHQPAPMVSRGVGGRDVPVHVIGPPDLVARFADWGWSPGLVPAADAPAWEMAAFRDRFLATFGPAGRERCASVAGAGPLPAAAGC